jgi:hypothetical protein
MQCIVVGNFLYVIGGCVSQCAHGESAVSTTYRYDPRLAKWSNTAPMLEKRAYFFACSLNLASHGDKKGYIKDFLNKNALCCKHEKRMY